MFPMNRTLADRADRAPFWNPTAAEVDAYRALEYPRESLAWLLRDASTSSRPSRPFGRFARRLVRALGGTGGRSAPRGARSGSSAEAPPPVASRGSDG